MTQTTQPSEWKNILSAGENILWQGAPDRSFHVPPKNLFLVIFGLFFAGFALFWMTMAYSAGGTFWMFGLLHFSVGVGIIMAALFGGTYKRRHTFYTLTDQNAYIATNLPIVGRKLNTYRITDTTPISYAPGHLATVHFATKQVRTKNGYRTVDIGFERIEDGGDVYRLIRQLQDPKEGDM